MGISYCSELLNRTIRSCEEKAKKLKLKFNRSHRYDYDTLNNIINQSVSYTECLNKLNISSSSSGNFDTLKKYIKKYNLDTSHFEKFTNSLKTYVDTIKLDMNVILVENSTYSRTSLKKRLYNEGYKERKCEMCGQTEEWNGKKMSLILDHINGVNDDNRIENLRIVCPNCNATLDTHSGKNKVQKIYDEINDKYVSSFVYKHCGCGRTILKNSECCVYCNSEKNRKVERPSKGQLLKEVEESNYCVVGRKYGVSDNTIRKWLKTKYKDKIRLCGFDSHPNF